MVLGMGKSMGRKENGEVGGVVGEGRKREERENKEKIK